MKFLRTFLTSIYVVLIILLLLRCCDGCHRTPPMPTTPTQPTPTPSPTTPDEPEVPIKESFKADVVMCIDVTGSMEAIINTIKENALRFYPDLKARCRREGKDIKSMRIRVIGFRDYPIPAGNVPMPSIGVPFEMSDFFKMPTQEEDFRSFVANLQPIGGGDGPEAGYDALALALKSEWDRSDDVRQVVILWTDDASQPAGRNPEVVKDYGELESLWKNMSSSKKRLFLFVPQHPTWEALARQWDKTICRDVTLGGGLTDVDYEEILRTISERV